MTGEEQRRTQMQVIAGVVRAYYGAVLAAESLKTAEQALKSAEADLRGPNRSARPACPPMSMCSRSGCISPRLPNSVSRGGRSGCSKIRAERRAGAASGYRPPSDHRAEPTGFAGPDAGVPGKGCLHHAPGEPSNPPGGRPGKDAGGLGPERAASAGAFHAAFEADRQQFVNKGGANWLASIGLRWNLFNGLADKARIEESSHWLERAHADEQRVDSAVRWRYAAPGPIYGRRGNGSKWRKRRWPKPRKVCGSPRIATNPA